MTEKSLKNKLMMHKPDKLHMPAKPQPNGIQSGNTHLGNSINPFNTDSSKSMKIGSAGPHSVPYYKKDSDVNKLTIEELFSKKPSEDEPMDTGITTDVNPWHYTVISSGNISGIGEIRLEDLQEVKKLGQGASGYVQKMLHVPSQTIIALKIIPMTGTTTLNDQIKSELRALHECASPHIVMSYGAFLHEGAVKIALEYMDAGTLQDIIKKVGGIPEVILGNIAHQVLKGLEYLHKVKKVIHRDIKPSNILINKAGFIKIADFGMSGSFDNSIEGKSSYVGTLCYMGPERLTTERYFPNSDIWSLGITLMECALGQFPFPKMENVFEFINYLVKNPFPTLSADKFSPGFQDFLANCLVHSSSIRPSSSTLLQHPFVHQYEEVSKKFISGWLNTL